MRVLRNAVTSKPAQPRAWAVAAPRWRRWASPAAIAWAFAYGSLRVYWASGVAPPFPPTGTDLIGAPGWWSVALCGAAAAVVLALNTAPGRWPLLVVAWGVTVALLAASALLLLDVVVILIPGLGLPFDLLAFLSRGACLAGGVLVGATALSYQRSWRGGCPACGRTGQAARPAEPPRWATWAAWAAVAGCLARVLAQAAVGFGTSPLQAGWSLLVFEAGFLLAGTVLPLALIYRWGRAFPAWVPLLAGRGVPRWLVLGPALGISSGLTAYFGAGTVQLAVETLNGTWQQGAGPLPLWFFWVALPAYITWGLGLGAAALAYQRTTRPRCRYCGR